MNHRVMTALAAACTCATLTASANAQQQSIRPAQQATQHSGEIVSSTISGFNIVLVVGETQSSGSASAEELPPAAKKALNDMREFLPYKHYRVLDVQWTSCCAPRNTTITGRLQGVVGLRDRNGALNLVPRGYGFAIITSASQQHLPVRFTLNIDETGAGRSPNEVESVRGAERERQDLQAEFETLGVQIKELQRRIEVGTEPAGSLRPMQDRHNSLKRRLADMESEWVHVAGPAGRGIMDSSFTMDAGETVVVGTSRLGGDKALIAILSAVRKAPGKRE
jgi:hypothetical protein